MKTNELTLLRQERIDRLRKMLSLNAPDLMISESCKIVFLASADNRNSKLRAGISLIVDWLRQSVLWEIQGRWGQFNCALGLHHIDESGSCKYCIDLDKDDELIASLLETELINERESL